MNSSTETVVKQYTPAEKERATANLRVALHTYDIATPQEQNQMSKHVKSGGKTPYQLNPQTQKLGPIMSIADQLPLLNCKHCGGQVAAFSKCPKSGAYHQ